MMKISRPSLFVILCLLVLISASLACSLMSDVAESSNEISLQQTSAAIKETETALSDQVAQNLTESVPEDVIATSEIPENTSDIQPDVTYEGISLSFDSSIANNIFSSMIPGQNMGEDYMPGDTYPTYFEFSLNGYPIAGHFHVPRIMVYPVGEFRSISSYASEIIDTLQVTLSSKPAGGPNANLPFLPMWNAAQIFASNVVYFDFQSGSGVRYLTMYGQAAYPVDNQNLFYTFQGLTNDGQYYISAILPVTHPDLPYDGGSEVDDWMAFDENFQTYLDSTVGWLNGQDSTEFTPNLALLDEMMASIASMP